jgi:hypothetical protein
MSESRLCGAEPVVLWSLRCATITTAYLPSREVVVTVARQQACPTATRPTGVVIDGDGVAQGDIDRRSIGLVARRQGASSSACTVVAMWTTAPAGKR